MQLSSTSARDLEETAVKPHKAHCLQLSSTSANQTFFFVFGSRNLTWHKHVRRHSIQARAGTGRGTDTGTDRREESCAAAPMAHAPFSYPLLSSVMHTKNASHKNGEQLVCSPPHSVFKISNTKHSGKGLGLHKDVSKEQKRQSRGETLVLELLSQGADMRARARSLCWPVSLVSGMQTLLQPWHTHPHTHIYTHTHTHTLSQARANTH